MKHINETLNDVIVVEEITEQTPFWAVLAIGLAGRLAADFGADVIRRCSGEDPLASPDVTDAAHFRALRSFLQDGKRQETLHPVALGSSGETRPHVLLRYRGGNSDRVSETRETANTKEVVFVDLEAAAPASRAPESEFTIAAMSGLLDIVGRSDSKPLMIGGHQISYATGLSGFLAAMALLHSDKLERAEVSALGTALWINWKSLAAAAQKRTIPRRSAESGKWRTARCADGYVALVYFDRDWPALSKMTADADMIAMSARRAWTDPKGLADLERRLESWALRHTRHEIAEASKALGLALGAVWTPAELLEDAQYREREFFRSSTGAKGDPVTRPRLPLVLAARVEQQGAASPRKRSTDISGPLAGIRVIDLGILTAGASTSALLADLGAEVIKVESPTYLDPFRGTPGTSRAEGWWNNSDAFKSTNRNKRGICLDLKSPQGRELFLQLAGQSDVVVENFRRGVMQRLGIGYDALRKANPGIILASVSSQGESGPDAGNISFGSTLEATSGLAALTAYEDGVPLVTGMDLNYPDQVGSVFAAGAIVAALRATLRTGEGGHLDISQRELATYLLSEHVIAAAALENTAHLGNSAPGYILQDAFAAQDGWVAVSIADRDQLIAAVSLAAPEMAGANSSDIEVFKQSIRNWIAGETKARVCERLREQGIAAAIVADGKNAWVYAQASGGGAVSPLAKSPSGDVVKGFPLHIPQSAITVRSAAPNLGQHTENVLADILGLTTSRIEQLARDEVIGHRPASPNASRLD